MYSQQPGSNTFVLLVGIGATARWLPIPGFRLHVHVLDSVSDIGSCLQFRRVYIVP